MSRSRRSSRCRSMRIVSAITATVVASSPRSGTPSLPITSSALVGSTEGAGGLGGGCARAGALSERALRRRRAQRLQLLHDVLAVLRQLADEAHELVARHPADARHEAEREGDDDQRGGNPVQAPALQAAYRRREQEREQHRERERDQDLAREIERGGEAGEEGERGHARPGTVERGGRHRAPQASWKRSSDRAVTW